MNVPRYLSAYLISAGKRTGGCDPCAQAGCVWAIWWGDLPRLAGPGKARQGPSKGRDGGRTLRLRRTAFHVASNLPLYDDDRRSRVCRSADYSRSFRAPGSRSHAIARRTRQYWQVKWPSLRRDGQERRKLWTNRITETSRWEPYEFQARLRELATWLTLCEAASRHPGRPRRSNDP
jgi:hypothetical protein